MDHFAVTFYDEEHSDDEDREITVGLSAKTRLLLVVHTEKDTKVQKTLRIDLDVLNWFMQEGEKRGIPYQTLMNAALKEVINKSGSLTGSQDDR